jgi:hypothetical protein
MGRRQICRLTTRIRSAWFQKRRPSASPTPPVSPGSLRGTRTRWLRLRIAGPWSVHEFRSPDAPLWGSANSKFDALADDLQDSDGDFAEAKGHLIALNPLDHSGQPVTQVDRLPDLPCQN